MKALQNSAIFYKMSTYKMPNGQSVNDYVGGGVLNYTDNCMEKMRIGGTSNELA